MVAGERPPAMRAYRESPGPHPRDLFVLWSAMDLVRADKNAELRPPDRFAV